MSNVTIKDEVLPLQTRLHGHSNKDRSHFYISPDLSPIPEQRSSDLSNTSSLNVQQSDAMAQPSERPTPTPQIRQPSSTTLSESHTRPTPLSTSVSAIDSITWKRRSYYVGLPTAGDKFKGFLVRVLGLFLREDELRNWGRRRMHGNFWRRVLVPIEELEIAQKAKSKDQEEVSEYEEVTEQEQASEVEETAQLEAVPQEGDVRQESEGRQEAYAKQEVERARRVYAERVAGRVRRAEAKQTAERERLAKALREAEGGRRRARRAEKDKQKAERVRRAEKDKQDALAVLQHRAPRPRRESEGAWECRATPAPTSRVGSTTAATMLGSGQSSCMGAIL